MIDPVADRSGLAKRCCWCKEMHSCDAVRFISVDYFNNCDCGDAICDNEQSAEPGMAPMPMGLLGLIGLVCFFSFLIAVILQLIGLIHFRSVPREGSANGMMAGALTLFCVHWIAVVLGSVVFVILGMTHTGGNVNPQFAPPLAVQPDRSLVVLFQLFMEILYGGYSAVMLIGMMRIGRYLENKRIESKSQITLILSFIATSLSIIGETGELLP